MEYEAEREMPADSRTVFGVAADVGTMERWLPREIDVRRIATDLVEGEADGDEVLMRAVPDQLRLEWGLHGRPDYTGWIQVMDRADGASTVVAHLSFLGDQPEASGATHSREATQRLLEGALDRLADLVEQQAARTAR
ncbi:SRPBCC family protein [Actinomadura kijaniata]|uniref:SRPBCC family protein n=1 Tax=Actinomadura kijaniata TaxID=46161 RepID=UPI003F1DABB8